MKHRVIVDRPVVAFIGERGLSRNALVRLYAQLHQELGDEAVFSPFSSAPPLAGAGCFTRLPHRLFLAI